ncbi:hypothetical protein Q9189_000906 [Teloschistes chrysophthalmus]
MSTYGRHFTQTIPKGRSSTEIMGHILIEQRASPAGLEKTNKDLVQSKTLLLKLAALSNTHSAAAGTSPITTSTAATINIRTPSQKVSKYTDDWVFEDTPSPKKPTTTHPGCYGAAINPTGSVLSLRTTNNFETSKAASDYYAAYCALSSTGSKTTEINPNTNTVNPKTGTTTSLPPFPLLSRIPRRQQQFPATTQLYPKIVRESDASTTNQLPPLHTNTMTLSSFLVNANQGFTNERTSERVRSPNSPAPITQDLYEQPTTTGNVARRRSCWANFQ